MASFIAAERQSEQEHTTVYMVYLAVILIWPFGEFLLVSQI